MAHENIDLHEENGKPTFVAQYQNIHIQDEEELRRQREEKKKKKKEEERERRRKRGEC